MKNSNFIMSLDRFLDIESVAKSIHGKDFFPEKSTIKEFNDAMDHQIIWESFYHKISWNMKVLSFFLLIAIHQYQFYSTPWCWSLNLPSSCSRVQNPSSGGVGFEWTAPTPLLKNLADFEPWAARFESLLENCIIGFMLMGEASLWFRFIQA